jgi:hypothetical protein
MGRMKELYIEMLEKEMDQMSTMEYLEMVYHRDLAERYEEERARLQLDQQTDLGEITEDSEEESV